MKEAYKISNIQFDKLLKLRPLLDMFNPDMGKGKFNCAVKFSHTGLMSFYIKDSSAYTQVNIPVTFEQSDFSVIGVYIEFSKLMYILGSYHKQNRLSSISFSISCNTETEEVSFFISNMNDSIHIPAQLLTDKEYKEVILEYGAHKDERSSEDLHFHYSFDASSKENPMIEGFASCLPFINDDEKKNNALALYKDKMVVCDNEHAYIKKYTYPALKEFTSSWVSIHKKTIKACLLLFGNKIPFTMEKSVDGKIVLGDDGSFFFCFMNDSIANIAPPEEEDLVNITPTTKIGTIEVKELSEAVTFISGFYTSNKDMNPVLLEKKQDFKLIFRDSLNQKICNIERIISNIEYETEEAFDVNIIINSLRKFLSQSEDERIEVYFQTDKPAVLLKGADSLIYLAKVNY